MLPLQALAHPQCLVGQIEVLKIIHSRPGRSLGNISGGACWHLQQTARDA